MGHLPIPDFHKNDPKNGEHLVTSREIAKSYGSMEVFAIGKTHVLRDSGGDE